LSQIIDSGAVSTVLGRRGDAHWTQARTFLASGRHSQALVALRRARRVRPATDHALLALSEADALLGLHRSTEAVRVSTRALRAPRLDGDVAVRLRIVRGRGLWRGGRVARGRAEVAQAAAVAGEKLTRARAEEALGCFAWKAQDHATALLHLDTAERLYSECGFTVGLVQALGHRAGVVRDSGQLEAALKILDRRLELALDLPRLDLHALARTDRASLHIALGRWDDATRDFDCAAAIFREMDDDREITVAGAGRVVIDLARGELPRARGVLSRLRELHQRRCEPRHLAEAFLLTSDAELAAGDAQASDRAAGDALGLFRSVGDVAGECRSRVRRVHALLAMDRLQDAERESGRALRDAGAARGDLRALALLAQGRALLQIDRRRAAVAFEDALAAGVGHPAFEAAARLGLAAAEVVDAPSGELTAAFSGMAAFGDRRMLAYTLADARRLFGRGPEEAVAVPVSSLPGPATGAGSAGAVAVARGLADAADAVAAAPNLIAGWGAAMTALQPMLGLRRAVLLLPDAGFEAREDLKCPVEVPANDAARLVADGVTEPLLLDLQENRFQDEPLRVLHGLRWAMVAPAGRATLYADTREMPPARAQEALGVLTAFGRLLAPRVPSAEPKKTARSGAPAIVFRCQAMRDAIQRVERAAAHDISVHLSGETGTGKELLAAALHYGSPRRDRPFEIVNASSLPDELFESLVFGHARGAFTGAVQEHEGHVVAAEGGTLFIDEVADLSPRAQAKLLRFLEKREYNRLGETRVRKADVRVVTAANRPLEEALRADLVFRIQELRIGVPPLRERGDDLVLLARHFLDVEARKMRRPAPVLRPDAIRVLESHAWTGNVRELQSEMKCALAMCGGGSVGPEHLFESRPRAATTPSVTLHQAVRRFEREYIARVLAAHDNNRSRTARALGISRQALLTKISGLGL
jgi:DNA-binding NtrC family response regulator/tetratricopeptide (TPR) repeat protein